MIFRFQFEAYIDNTLIFQCACKSLNHVARIYDQFIDNDDYALWFEVYDIINCRSIDVNELMRIYHGEIHY